MTHPVQCRFCAAVPALETRFRSVRSVSVWFRITTVPGPFCRTCATAVFRHVQYRTLTLGWYGYLTPYAVIVLALNLVRLNKAAALAPPAPDSGALDPGRPLHTRPKVIIGVVVPVVLLIALVVLALIADATATPPGQNTVPWQ